MEVRPFEADDRAACERLFGELVDAHRALYPDTEIGEAFELPAVTFVAVDQGRVVGYAGLEWQGRRAQLEPIVVASDRRRSGEHTPLTSRRGPARSE